MEVHQVKPEYTKIVAAIPHSVLGETMAANKIAAFVGLVPRVIKSHFPALKFLRFKIRFKIRLVKWL